jgi:hypothetical protein
VKRFRIFVTETAQQVQILAGSNWVNLFKPARRRVSREEREIQRTCQQLIQRGYEEEKNG